MTDRMSIVTFPISRKLADDIDALPPDLKEKLLREVASMFSEEYWKEFERVFLETGEFMFPGKVNE